ncbi:MAG TPA: hypothetical protein VME66_11235 [Candidatus Acidoferrales bacterium]|nr:hypothetical protein [Candidatus Acidoferrales bacterium]
MSVSLGRARVALLWSLFVLALYACSVGGGGGGGSGVPNTTPEPTPPGLLMLSPAALNFSALGQTQTFTVKESGYTGTFSVNESSPGVVTVSPAPSGGEYAVTAVGAGAVQITVTDSYSQSQQISVGVTAAALGLQ